MEWFEVLILIGRLFFIMNIAQISTENLKLKRDFRRKQKWSQKIPLFLMLFIMNLLRHYKHNNEEVRVLGIVKIGWILVILGQFPQMWVGYVGRRSILRKLWWFQDYRSYDGNKLSLIWHFLNKDEIYNFLETQRL